MGPGRTCEPGCAAPGARETISLGSAGRWRGMSERQETMPEVNDWNAAIIAEFRANEGRVGGQFQGAPLLLLHTTGAKSGQERVNPMMYQQVGGSYAVFASKAGAPTNPDWYHNLLAHPSVTAEIGTQTVQLTARVAEGAEREQIWDAQKQAYPGFAEYEAKTDRQIPVVILDAR
jgi:deazaflavin-dependent oxidoreductase (nitroreductase family)